MTPDYEKEAQEMYPLYSGSEIYEMPFEAERLNMRRANVEARIKQEAHIKARLMSEAELQRLRKGNERKGFEWNTELGIDNAVHVPDDLRPLYNKLGMQFGFMTISNIITDVEMLARMVHISQDFFSKHPELLKPQPPVTH